MGINEPAHPPQRCTQILDHFGWQRHILPLDDSGYRAEINARLPWMLGASIFSATASIDFALFEYFQVVGRTYLRQKQDRER